MDIELDVGGREELSNVYRALGVEDRNLPRTFRKIFLKEAKFRAKEASKKVLAEPALKGKHTGLRERVEKGVDVTDLSEGKVVAVSVITRMPKEDQAIIPRGLDGFNGWRHPFFGDKKRWYRQHGAFSWFMDSMQPSKESIHTRLAETLEGAAQRIDKAAGG